MFSVLKYVLLISFYNQYRVDLNTVFVLLSAVNFELSTMNTQRTKFNWLQIRNVI